VSGTSKARALGQLEPLFAAWRANDAAGAAAHFTLDAVYHEAKRGPVRGRAAIEAKWARFFAAVPVWRIEVDDIFGVGDKVAIAYRFGIKKAADEWDDRPGCALIRLRDGAVAEWREYEG
jgi:ketosteroid isomerase-like protein